MSSTAAPTAASERQRGAEAAELVASLRDGELPAGRGRLEGLPLEVRASHKPRLGRRAGPGRRACRGE